MKTEQKPLHSGLGDSTVPRAIMGNHRLDGKTVLITGGHSGIGLVGTKALSEAGAHVVVAARDIKKARQALAGLKNVTFQHLDLADPHSIDTFSDAFVSSNPKLDILINNAGIMALPSLNRDSRGYELQFATNHLGHFQLTARLWGVLKSAKNARVISLSSYGHRFSEVHFEDIHFNQRPYEKWSAYGQSKTANSLFAVELDRRGEPFGIRAFAVHPGRIPATNLKRFMSLKEKVFRHPIRHEIETGLEGGFKSLVFFDDVVAGQNRRLKGGVFCSAANMTSFARAVFPIPRSPCKTKLAGIPSLT